MLLVGLMIKTPFMLLTPADIRYCLCGSPSHWAHPPTHTLLQAESSLFWGILDRGRWAHAAFMPLPCCLLSLLAFRAVQKSGFTCSALGAAFCCPTAKQGQHMRFLFMLRRILINCNCRSRESGGVEGHWWLVIVNLAWSAWKNRKVWAVGKKTISALVCYGKDHSQNHLGYGEICFRGERNLFFTAFTDYT